jgi:thymidylate synthase ThyX
MVEIIADSINEYDKRLTTFVIDFPKVIQAELNTHRMLSKSSGSSRAIKTDRFIKDIELNPFIPIWNTNKAGMQGNKLEDEILLKELNMFWIESMNDNINKVRTLSEKYNVHKQISNRYLDLFKKVKVVVSGTEWENFFSLRNHKDAQPDFKIIAEEMEMLFRKNNPNFLKHNQWHLPFSDKISNKMVKEGVVILEQEGFEGDKKLETKLRICTARVARTSYENFDGKLEVSKDFDLFNKLITTKPVHASPSEALAKVPSKNELKDFTIKWVRKDKKFVLERGKYSSNFDGWIQYRKILESRTINK